ncbi:MAG: energy transducer TonB [Balneolales bacterium]|nr:energy transducer TonB [Balneolales bacterium]
MPEMIGGQRALYRNLVYPNIARRSGIEGRVILQFIVDENGRPQDINILRDPGGGLGDAAVNALRQVRFTPGMQRGKAVRVQLTQPVVFRLSD